MPSSMPVPDPPPRFCINCFWLDAAGGNVCKHALPEKQQGSAEGEWTQIVNPETVMGCGQWQPSPNPPMP